MKKSTSIVSLILILCMFGTMLIVCAEQETVDKTFVETVWSDGITTDGLGQQNRSYGGMLKANGEWSAVFVGSVFEEKLDTHINMNIGDGTYIGQPIDNEESEFNGQSTYVYYGMKFETGRVINKYTITNSRTGVTNGPYPYSWVFEGTNDVEGGGNPTAHTKFTELDRRTGEIFTTGSYPADGQQERKSYQFTNSTQYQYYRIRITQSSNKPNGETPDASNLQNSRVGICNLRLIERAELVHTPLEKFYNLEGTDLNFGVSTGTAQTDLLPEVYYTTSQGSPISNYQDLKETPMTQASAVYDTTLLSSRTHRYKVTLPKGLLTGEGYLYYYLKTADPDCNKGAGFTYETEVFQARIEEPALTGMKLYDITEDEDAGMEIPSIDMALNPPYDSKKIRIVPVPKEAYIGEVVWQPSSHLAVAPIPGSLEADITANAAVAQSSLDIVLKTRNNATVSVSVQYKVETQGVPVASVSLVKADQSQEDAEIYMHQDQVRPFYYKTFGQDPALEPTYRLVQWESSNPTVATVDSVGQVTAISQGETVITVTSLDNNSCTDHVTINVMPVAIDGQLSYINGLYLHTSGTLNKQLDGSASSFEIDLHRSSIASSGKISNPYSEPIVKSGNLEEGVDFDVIDKSGTLGGLNVSANGNNEDKKIVFLVDGMLDTALTQPAKLAVILRGGKAVSNTDQDSAEFEATIYPWQILTPQFEVTDGTIALRNGTQLDHNNRTFELKIVNPDTFTGSEVKVRQERLYPEVDYVVSDTFPRMLRISEASTNPNTNTILFTVDNTLASAATDDISFTVMLKGSVIEPIHLATFGDSVLANVTIKKAGQAQSNPNAGVYSGGGSGGGGGGGSYAASSPTQSQQQQPQQQTQQQTASNTDVVPNVTKEGFKDVEEEWAKEPIRVLTEKGIVKGVDQESFAPDRGITRAEFAVILVRALDIKKNETETAFEDVTSDSWFKEDVEAAASHGLIQGYEGIFNPDGDITREEMAVVIFRALNMLEVTPEQEGEQDFQDKEDIAPWAQDAVTALVQLEIVNGSDDNNYLPKQGATRAQAAVIIYRLLGKVGRI